MKTETYPEAPYLTDGQLHYIVFQFYGTTHHSRMEL